MDLNNIIMSANYLEFINDLDDLIFDILYNEKTGYTNLNSKNAIDETEFVIRNFEESVEKIKEKSKLDNLDEVVEDKRKYLTNEIKKHYTKQALIWCDEIYDNLIENCMTSIMIDKQNRENVDKNFKKAISAISWISNIKGLNHSEQNVLFENFNLELDKVLKENSDTINPKTTIKTDPKTYLKLLNLFLDDEEKFSKEDLTFYNQKLSNQDLEYFINLQKNLNTYKINSIKDEISLIKSALELLNLKNDTEKYDFIVQIENDFKLQKTENKSLNLEDKISLTKKRMQIFKDKISSKDSLNYFKNLLNKN